MSIPAHKTVYLLSGGVLHHRKAHDPLIREMLRETGREHPTVACLGAANNDDPAAFDVLHRLFRSSDAGAFEAVPLGALEIDPAHIRARLAAADAIFLGEGDVDHGMRVLRASGVIPLLRERWEQGAVFAGFSAGSILLSRQWVRWHDPTDDASAEAFDCLGFVPLVCDMHDESDGWEELKTLLRLRRVPDEIGYGVPISMGLRVHPDGRIEAVGGWVHRHTFRDGRVDNIGDIWPAFFVHPSEYEYQI